MRGSAGNAGHGGCRHVEHHQVSRPAAPMGGGVGLGGGNTVSSSHKEATDIRGGGSTAHPGGAPSLTPCQPPLSNHCCLCFSNKKALFFFFPEATSKVGTRLGWGRRRRSVLPAPPCPHPLLPPAKASWSAGAGWHHRHHRCRHRQSSQSHCTAARARAGVLPTRCCLSPPTPGLQSVPKKKK